MFVGYDTRSAAYLVHYSQSERIERVRCVKLFDEENEVSIEERSSPAPTGILIRLQLSVSLSSSGWMI